jgi:hypothetical protein
MPTTIRYADILNYLTAIMTKETNPIGDSPHGEWWSGLSYKEFTEPNNQVPNTGVNIMDLGTPLQSPFYLILTNTSGYQGIPQMPLGGPYITDTGYSAKLSDGTMISGATIAANIESWLSNSFPE